MTAGGGADRRALYEKRRVIVSFIGCPRHSGNIRKLRHPPCHVLRHVNILLAAILLAPIGNVRAECLQKYRDLISTSDLLGGARVAVENAILAQLRVLVDLIERYRIEQSILQRLLEGI